VALSRPKLKYLRSLQQKKFRDREKRFIVEGFRLTSEALDSDFVVEEVFYTAGFLENAEHAALVQRCRKGKRETIEVRTRELERFADTVTAQGVAALVRQRHFRLEDVVQTNRRRQVIIALDALAEPGNVGTIIRTGDWFGASGILLGRGTVELYNPKVVRSTMGSIFHLPIVSDVDLEDAVAQIRKQGFRVFAATVDGDGRYDETSLASKAMLIIGNETQGVSQAVLSLADERITIPRVGRAESLNAGVAAGILLARFLSNHISMT
jgi:TrmH family RNA methyltransferase